MEEAGIITPEEIKAAGIFMEKALSKGASGVRVTLNKSTFDSYSALNGEFDKVTHAADRSVFMHIFADGRYGTFSTNMLEAEKAEEFVSGALETVRLLAPDPFRRLPDPSRTAKDALKGDEVGLYDRSWSNIGAEEKLSSALSLARYGKSSPEEILKQYGCSVISEECEYSDSVDDLYVIDSQGFIGRQTKTSFSCGSEVTVADKKGRKYGGYWWDLSPFRSELDLTDCSLRALEKAARQIGPKKIRSGKYNMVVDRSVSPRLVAPIFSALNAMSLQQKNSFLQDSLGKKVFSPGLTIMDLARTPGMPGSRLFDSEGVATADVPVIQEGEVKMYFVNTYMAGKTGMEPTVEDISRPVLLPYACGRTGALVSKEKEVSLQALCGSGIYVTGFNGGNCNPTTGDFSYGVEGFAIENGEISHPVREMVITGNMISLWNSLLAAGNDARKCTRWKIPSLAFRDVDFSA